MSTELNSIALIPLFRDGLKFSGIGPGQTVAVFTNERFRFPEYTGAVVGACKELGAEIFVIQAPGRPTIDHPFIVDSWKAADLVVTMFSALPPHMWMYSDQHNEVLNSGTRTLLIMEPPPTLRRLFPNSDVIRRGYAGGELLQASSEVRIVDDHGTDLVFSKKDRKTSVCCGCSDRPGRWDHWGAAMVHTAPIEDSTEGTFVLNPGDVIMGLLRRVESKVKLTFRSGKIVSIEGGYDAKLLQDHLDAIGDDGAYRLSHAGWGTDHRADWNVIGMDIESAYGTIDVAIGRNMFNSPDKWSGFNGKNWSLVHCDNGTLGKSLYLDDKLIIDKGKFTVDDLR